MEEKESTLKDEIRELTRSFQDSTKEKKPKRFRTFKARLSKGKLRKGYVIVAQIDPNRTVNFRKEPIVDGTIKLDDTYHAINDLDIFLYQPVIGKSIPMVFQAKHRINPWDPESGESALEGENQTYGQKHVMARMIADEIKQKKSISFGVIFIVIVVLIGGFYLLSQGGFI